LLEATEIVAVQKIDRAFFADDDENVRDGGRAE